MNKSRKLRPFKPRQSTKIIQHQSFPLLSARELLRFEFRLIGAQKTMLEYAKLFFEFFFACFPVINDSPKARKLTIKNDT